MKNDTLIIKDASEEVIRKIEDKKANKLIIAGQNGSGKTTTLKYYTNKNIDNNVIYIDYKNIFYDYSLNTIENFSFICSYRKSAVNVSPSIVTTGCVPSSKVAIRSGQIIIVINVTNKAPPMNE